MNRQDLIKQYKEYGFSDSDIAKELGISVFLVKSALIPQKRASTEIKAKTLRYKSWEYDKMNATDRTKPMWELVYKHKPYKINKYINKIGYRDAAEVLGCKMADLVGLKMHFGYHNSIPKDALNKTGYFPEEIRRKVDERDQRRCIRCDRECGVDNIRYHKISHPGANVEANCATLCTNCRTHRILKHYDVDHKRFLNMEIDEFKAWIHENDPYHKRNRVYPKGQVGKWSK